MYDFEIEYKGDLSTEIIHVQSDSRILTDAPKDNNGLGRTFSPTDLLASGLGSCMLTIIAIAAKTNNIIIEKMFAKVNKIMSDNLPRKISQIVIQINLYGNFDSKSITIIERAAKHCPVHQSINSDVILNFTYNK